MTTAMFVHGLGRTPVSGCLLLRRLERRGVTATSFGYVPALSRFADIRGRLVRRIISLADRGNYVLIGHSLGGLLLRAALAELPPGVRRPDRLFLLASPINASSLAQRFSKYSMFRLFSGECGRILASPSLMGDIADPHVPTTAIVGLKQFPLCRLFPVGMENDGIVSVSEVSADWLGDVVYIPVSHTFVPMSRITSDIIQNRLGISG